MKAKSDLLKKLSAFWQEVGWNRENNSSRTYQSFGMRRTGFFDSTKYKSFTNIQMYEKGFENKVIFKELSYNIIGAIFEVYNTLGYGFKERYYEDAISKEFDKRGIKYRRQYVIDLKYKGDDIGKYRLDFLVEDVIVIELKTGDFYSRQNMTQVVQYLKTLNLKLAILVNITQHGVKYRRVLNIR